MFLRISFIALVSLVPVSSVRAQSQPKPLTDALGDPLPPGAIARLGTNRLNVGLHSFMEKAWFSPDGSKIASVSSNLGSEKPANPACLWDSTTGKPIEGQWQGSRAPFGYSFGAISKDGRIMAAGYVYGMVPGPGFTTMIHAWDTSTGKPFSPIEIDDNSAGFAFVGEKGSTLVSVQLESVQWWDLETGKQSDVWNSYLGNMLLPPGIIKEKVFLYQSKFAPDGKYLTVELIRTQFPGDGKPRFSNFQLILFDLQGRKELWRSVIREKVLMTEIFPTPTSLCFSGDGKRVAVAVGMDRIEVRETLTGKVVAAPPKSAYSPDRPIRSLALSANGRHVAAVQSQASEAVIIDLDNPTSVRKLPIGPYSDNITTQARVFCFSPDDKSLLVGHGSRLRLHDVATLKHANLLLSSHRDSVDYLAFSSDRQQLLSGNVLYRSSFSSRSFHISESMRWDAKMWKWLHTSDVVASDIVFPSADHSVYASYGAKGDFELRDMSNGKLLAQLDIAPIKKPTESGLFSPSGKRFMLYRTIQGPQKEIEQQGYMFDVTSGKMLCQMPVVPFVTTIQRRPPVVFSTDERMMAMFAYKPSQIHVVDTANGKLLHILGKDLGKAKPVTNLAFSPDGKFLASWYKGDGVRKWDLASGKERFVLSQPDSPENLQFAFAPDGRSLAVGDKSIRVIELSTQKVRREFKGHEGAITSLAFSPDGRLLASGSTDSTILIWDAWR